MRDQGSQLLVGLATMAVVALLPMRQAVAICNGSAGNGVAEEIAGNNCTVATGNIPTTVTFQAGATGHLILNGAAPTDVVSNVTSAQGIVDVQGTVTMGQDFGSFSVGNIHLLSAVNVQNGAELKATYDINAETVTVGQGTSGTLTQNEGNINVSTLEVKDGATLTQAANTGSMSATNIKLGNGATLTIRNSSTGGTVNGIADGQGSLIIDHGSFQTHDAVGGVHRLNTITLTSGSTLSLTKDVSANTITINGTVNQANSSHAATTLTASTLLAIGTNASFTQTDGSIRAGAITLDSGATLSLKNQGSGTIDGAAAGQGTLTFTGNYNTDQAIGGTNKLASMTVNDGVTLTLDQNASATTVNVGQGSSGVINQSAGTLSATTLAIKAGGSVTQSGSGVINASATTLGSGASLTLANQGSGTIDGAAAGQGTLTFTGNYNTDQAIGGTNKLASMTVNDGVTLTLDQNASATTVNVGQGSSGVINQSAGTLSATTLAIKAGGSVTQSGSGVINASATTLGSGASLTLANQGSGTIDGAAAGQGTLTFTGNYNTDQAIGGTNKLASMTVNDGVTLTLDQNTSATTVNVGQGSSGVINQSAGTLSATTLAIKAGGSVTQSGSGVINASATTLGSGASLTLANQGSGTIDGAAAGQGTLTFTGNYNTDQAIGGTNQAGLHDRQRRCHPHAGPEHQRHHRQCRAAAAVACSTRAPAP